VSQLDPTTQVSIGAGLRPIPGFTVRRAATTLELRDGQSFMIGGLLQNETRSDMEQVPWLGSLPVIGTLFSSRSYQRKETDLAIIVTPRLVKPARPGAVIATPLDSSLPANDIDHFVGGQSEVSRADHRVLIGHAIPFTGHVLDLSKGDTNVVAVRN
jgi:pilus assembly protein CpaC